MMRPSTNTDTNIVDQQTRLVTNRINQTEKFFEDLGQGFATYARKSARLRDTLDDLSRVILEPINVTEDSLTIERGLVDLGHALTHLADARDWETGQIETKILADIGQYDQVCKSLREEVKINASIRNKEVLRKRAAEQKRGSTVLRADRDFEKIVEEFEEQKNKDLHEVMMNFVNIQLKVHLDGVNQMTELYRKLKDVDCSEDATKFRDTILQAVPVEREELKPVKSRSQSMGALNNLMHPGNPFRRLSTKPQQPERLNRSQENIVEATRGAPKITLPETEEDDGDGTTEEDEEEEEETDTERESFRRTHNQLHVPK